MPTLNIEAVQDLIRREAIGAVSLDTSVFDQFGCNLSYATLLGLKQFGEHKIPVLLTDVVLGEVTRHIARDIGEATEKARAAINQYKKARRFTKFPSDGLAALDLDQDAKALAQTMVQAFVEAVAAEVVEAEGRSSVAEILSRYFGAEPPFSGKKTKPAESDIAKSEATKSGAGSEKARKSDGGAKKSEFPDAIALTSLESWAEENDTQVLVFSRDGDWQAFAEASERLVCTPSLKEGLNLINHTSKGVVDQIFARILASSAPKLDDAIGDAIYEFASEFEIEAETTHFYDVDPDYIVLNNWRAEETIRPLIVEADEASVTFSIRVVAEIEFRAHFRFSAYDREDKEYIPLASTDASTVQSVPFPITVRVDRDDLEELQSAHVQVERRSLTIDFGMVEPDWGYGD